MSQAKVDRYKEEKKNRAKIMAKEKRQAAAWKIGGTVCALALCVWLGSSVYSTVTNRGAQETEATPAVSYTVNTSALTDYINGLD